MDLVYELFAKLGLRYICVLKDGKYAGMVSIRGLLLMFSLRDANLATRPTRRPLSDICGSMRKTFDLQANQEFCAL